MSGEGGATGSAAPLEAYGLAGVLLLTLGLYVAFAAAEIAAFLVAAPGPPPENLSPATIYAARAGGWWREPFILIAPILYLPVAMTLEWARSPHAMIAAFKRVKPSVVWIGPAVFVIGLAAFASAPGADFFKYLALAVAALVGVAVATLLLFGWATRAGLPQSAVMMLASAIGGAVFGVGSAAPNAALRCEHGAAVRLGRAAVPCAEILVYSGREAHLIRRPDGAVLVLPKAGADRASLRAAVGPRSIWFDDVAPID